MQKQKTDTTAPRGDNSPAQAEAEQRLDRIPLDKVRRSPYQVRREESPGPEMLASVAIHGLINPITVRPTPDGAFELMAGHRRFAAWREVRPSEPVPAIVIAADDMMAEDLLVSENFFRRDLSLMEEAMSVAQLRAHGRTVEQVAAVVHKSERWVYRRMAIGNVAPQWRGFLHAWDLPYETIRDIARLPGDVQSAAWGAFLSRLSDVCDFRVRAGNAEDRDSREAFVSALELARDDRAEFARIVAGAFLPAEDSAARGEAAIRAWFDPADVRHGLGAVMGAARLLDPKACPFDCAAFCAKCAKRSDAQPDLFADDGARTVPRCLDGACWAAATAAAKQSSSNDKPGTDGNKEVPRSAPPSATSSDAAPESGEKGGASSSPDPAAVRLAESATLAADSTAPDRALPPSPAPEPRTAPEKTSLRPDAGGNDRSPARAEASLSDADLGVRMGVVWTVAQLLLGDRLEEILPKMAALRADEVRRGGWRKAVREKALPRLARNKDSATAALATVEGMW